MERSERGETAHSTSTQRTATRLASTTVPGSAGLGQRFEGGRGKLCLFSSMVHDASRDKKKIGLEKFEVFTSILQEDHCSSGLLGLECFTN